MTTRLNPLRRCALRMGIAGVTAAVALSACGSTDSGGASSGSSSDSKDTSTVQLDDTMDAGDLGNLITDAMKAKGSGVMTVAGSGAFAMNATTEFTFAGGEMASKTSADPAGQQIDAITTADGSMYISGIPMSAKKWVKLDLGANDPMVKAMSGMSQNFGSPGAIAQKLAGIEAKRTANTGGESTYEFKVDTAKLIGVAADPTATEVTMTWVVQEDGLPVSASVTGIGDTETKTTYSDWGKDITIEAPPADEVGEMSDLKMPELKMPAPAAS